MGLNFRAYFFILFLAILVEYFGGGAQLLSLFNSIFSYSSGERFKRAPVPLILVERAEQYECPTPENMLAIPKCMDAFCTDGWSVLYGESKVSTEAILMGPTSTSIISNTVKIPITTENGDTDASYTLALRLQFMSAVTEIHGSYAIKGNNHVPFVIKNASPLYITQEYSNIAGIFLKILFIIVKGRDVAFQFNIQGANAGTVSITLLSFTWKCGEQTTGGEQLTKRDYGVGDTKKSIN
jgi:hypothetical protein